MSSEDKKSDFQNGISITGKEVNQLAGKLVPILWMAVILLFLLGVGYLYVDYLEVILQSAQNTTFVPHFICAIICVHKSGFIMQSFSIRDLRERTGDISRAAEDGELSLVTRHGHPLFISVPFNQHVIEHGVYLALAENLFKSEELSLGKAAKLANMSRVEFGEHVSSLGIPLVNYDASELDAELDYFN